jgi:hypothetical protein
MGVFSFAEKEIQEPCEEDELARKYLEEIDRLNLIANGKMGDLQQNALYFIAGSLARKYLEKYPCDYCEACMLVTMDHTHSSISVSDFRSLTSIKNRGGLLFVSRIIMDIIVYTEKIYRYTVVAGKLRTKNLKNEMLRDVRKYFIKNNALQSMGHPVIDTADFDQHELKILNFMASKYLLLRIYTQCKIETLAHLGDKSTMRQHLHHLTLFSNT